MMELRSMGLAALLFTLVACGGGGDGAPAPPAPPVPPAATEVASGQSAQLSLGAGGGTLSLATREGASFTLELPAGALPATTELRLVTATASARQRFHLRLEPAGLVLEGGRSATLTITLPGSLPVPAGAALAYDGVPLPVQRLTDGRLQVQLSAFAAAVPGAAVGERQALSARRLAATTPPCGSAPAVGDFASGGLTASNVVDIDLYGQCMVGAVQALADNGRYLDAARAAQATAALLQAGGVQGNVGNATALAFIAQASSIACTALRRAIDEAENATAQGPDHARRYGQPVLMWQKTVDQLGALCTQVSPTEYLDAMRAVVLAALDWYRQQLAPRITDTTSADYTGAVAAAQGHRDAVREVASLPGAGSGAGGGGSNPNPVDTAAREQLGQRAQNGLIDAIVQGPWQRCRDSGNFDELIRLMQLGNELAAVKQAAQYCVTQLQAQAKNNAGTVTATLTPTLGGVRAGEQRTSGAINVDKDGRLELSGPIRALQCAAGQAGGSESLEIRLGSTVLQTITAAPYVANTITIDIAQALQAAGINASSFTSGTLTLARTGSPCGGFWGDNPQPLLSLTLHTNSCQPPAGRQVCVSDIDLPAGVQAKGMNRRGDVLVRDVNATSHVFLLRSAGGNVQQLPADCENATVLEDDAVVANTERLVDNTNRVSAHELLLWRNGTRTTIKQWASAPASQGPILNLWAANPDSGAIMAQEWEQRAFEPADLGWCARVDSGGNPNLQQWSCRRQRLYTAASASVPLQQVYMAVNSATRYLDGIPFFQRPNAQGDWRLMLGVMGTPNGRPVNNPYALLRIEHRGGSTTTIEPYTAPGVPGEQLAMEQQTLFDVPAAAGWGAGLVTGDDFIETHTRGHVLFRNGTRGLWLDVRTGAVVAEQPWAALDARQRPETSQPVALDGHGRLLVSRADGGGWLVITPRGAPLP